ncbi:DUF255 domain-containing protein [Tundrisphaera lichenicola]|uniref:DUF255 domain-containing protein n=1 Tax=Tundrisphaera lichenicola TaxID=2029860 RepID=UPI003EBD45AA
MLHRRSTLLATVLLLLSGLAPGDEPKFRPQGPANRLAKETSPYLLLHAHNPVDWYPWGPEAFARAKAENKPIFLSIGYSSCYWCHVMERESFTDPAIAKLINARFVAIKVDREERPDVDQVYMTAVQAFSGSGGWPMSVFMTPDGRPFFGGTYFRPADFSGLLNAVSEAWRDHRPAIEKDADNLAGVVRRASAGPSKVGRVPLSRDLAQGGIEALRDQFDPEFGGFGFDPARPKRPKFPEPANLLYLLDQHRRQKADQEADPETGPLAMALTTFDAMARGGIRDHLAGGYHRYSTVRDWSVPHFEKMLYDNAQLAEAHVLAFEATGDPRWKTEAEATFAFVERTLTSPEGLFYSSLDAESEGEEGKSYVWTPEEVEKILGPEFPRFAHAYGLDARPNFEDDRYVLVEPKAVADRAIEAELAPARAKLLAVRDKRPAPLLDDKVLTSWNALMIGAYAEGYRVLKDKRYKQAAEKASAALLNLMTAPDGRLLRTAREGQAKLPAYLEDYAFLAHALLRLHKATGEPKPLDQARTLVDRMIADFADPEDGGFFYTASDHEALLARVKDPFDNAIPGANSLAVRSLVELGVATGEARYLDEAGRALGAFAPSLATRPGGSPLMLLALEEYLDARPPKPEDETSAPLPGAPGVVTARASEPKPATIEPGGEFEVALALTIQEGFHLYANPAGSEDVIPTSLSLGAGPKADLIEIDYPDGEAKALAANGSAKVNVYEKATRITARVRLAPDAKPGPATLVLRVRYQACTDRACLAPAALEVPVNFEVKGR